MEADWSVELSSGDPVIAVPWEATGEDAARCRFVDLRGATHHVDEIDEALANPPLRTALLRLHGAGSPVWTAKCDAWNTSPDKGDAPLDPYEMGAEPGATTFGSGCYIDLLPRNSTLLLSFDQQLSWLHALVDRLRRTPAAAVHVELVMRPAFVDSTGGYGLTCFVQGCGATANDAGARWAEALRLTVAVLLDTPCAPALRDDTMAETGE